MSFKSLMQHIGHDIKVGLEFILPFAETAGKVAIAQFAPGLGSLYNQTVAVVGTQEQAAVALSASGIKLTSEQKFSNVLAIMGPLVSQTLKDAGKDNSAASVATFINGVVSAMNLAPAPPSA